MKKVSIVIVNWNNWPDTLECLESLKKIDYPDYRIILVDNGSTDGSAEKIKEYIKDFIRCSLFAVRCNVGFAGGNNLGIDYALKNGADYVLLLNNDTIVDKDFLRILTEAAEENKKAGILGLCIYYYNNMSFPDLSSRNRGLIGKSSINSSGLSAPRSGRGQVYADNDREDKEKIWFLGGKFKWLKTRWTKGRGHLGLDFPINDNFKKRPQKVDFITGCCMLIKREVFEKIGKLDEKFFLYYEDVDYCLRARKARYDCLVVPQAKIWHKISVSAKKLGSPQILRYHYRNALLLTEKNAPVLFRWLRHLWAGLIAAKQMVKIIFLPGQKVQSRAIIKGIGDYYKRKFGKV